MKESESEACYTLVVEVLVGIMQGWTESGLNARVARLPCTGKGTMAKDCAWRTMGYTACTFLPSKTSVTDDSYVHLGLHYLRPACWAVGAKVTKGHADSRLPGRPGLRLGGTRSITRNPIAT